MRDVTGGDLYYLWKAAEVHFPRLADQFWDANQFVANADESVANAVFARDDDSGNADPHGAWCEVRRHIELILAVATTHLSDTAAAITRAQQSFAAQDTDAAAALDKLRQGLPAEGVDMHNENDPTENPPALSARAGEPSVSSIYENHEYKKATRP